MKSKYQLSLVLVFSMSLCWALKLSDFTPGFLKSESAVPESGMVRVLPDCATGESMQFNIFCKNKLLNNNARSVADTSVAAGVVNDTNHALPDANQSSLRIVPPVKANSQQELLNNLSLPIKADKNMNFNISPQQIELNIKY